MNVLARLAPAVTALILASAALADPSKVVKAAPENGAADIDPKTAELRIEFDQDMSHVALSLCGGGDHFPKVTGTPNWIDKRTILIPISLKPAWEYECSVNCANSGRFKNEAGESAVPYPIKFRTAPATPGEAAESPARKLTPQDNQRAIAELRRTIQDNYSYRDRLKLDWDKLFSAHAANMEAAESPAAFARAAGDLLAEAKDIHIWLNVGGQVIGSYQRMAPLNCNLGTLARLVPGWKQHNAAVSTGRFDDGVAYLLISTWSPKDGPAALDPAFSALAGVSGAKGVIIDVRPNAGGDENLARTLAGCFVAAPAVYARHEVRDPSAPGGFAKPLDRTVEPTPNRPAFRGKVAVLMGRQNVSSCEAFLAMMRFGAKARLFGADSWGGSGNPLPHPLSNGVTVFLPSWRAMFPDGTPLEGVGIKPDTPVPAQTADFSQKDPVLDAALAWIRQ